MRPSVLVSGPQAESLAEVLRPDVDAVAASSEAEARAYLSGTAFDRVLDTSSDGAVAALAAELGLTAERLDPTASPDALRARLGLGSGLAPASGADVSAGERPSAVDADRLRAVGEALAVLAHDLNNPIAVIQGNAQLALELGRDLDLDPTLAESLRDIESASQDLAVRFRELGQLRQTLDDALGDLGV